MKNTNKFITLQFIITALLPIVAMSLLPMPAVVAHILVLMIWGIQFYFSYARYLPSLNCDKLVQYYFKKFFFEFNIFIILLLAIPSSVIYSSYTDYQDRSAWTPAAQMHTLSGSLPSKITIIHKYRYSNDYFKINDILFSCSTGTIQLCHTDFFKYGNQTAEILYTHDIDNRKIIYQINLPKQTLLRYEDAQASILNQRQDSIKQGMMVFFVMFLPYLCLLLNGWRIAIYRTK